MEEMKKRTCPGSGPIAYVFLPENRALREREHAYVGGGMVGGVCVRVRVKLGGSGRGRSRDPCASPRSVERFSSARGTHRVTNLKDVLHRPHLTPPSPPAATCGG